MAGKDSYSNKFYGKVLESAANTLTCAEIQTATSIFDKTAWIIHRLEYYLLPPIVNLLVGLGDEIHMALTSNNRMTAFGLDDPSVIDVCDLYYHQITAVGFAMLQMPIIRDFSGMPGGGLIVAPRPLYAGIMGVSLTSAAQYEIRGYFSQVQLKADEYLELVDFYRIVK